MNISVVIPTYNSELFIVETLRSVESQTLQPRGVIIVDDGSSDGTVKVVTDYAKGSKLNIRILKNNRRKGQSGATNCGILNAANAEFIAFLDSDDLWLPCHLEQLSAYLERYPGVDIAFSGFSFFGEAEDIDQYSQNSRNLVVKVLNKSFNQKEANVWLSSESLLKTSLIDGVPFRCPASLIRAQVFHNKNLYFDEDVTYTMDGLFFIMAAAYAQFLYVDKIGLQIRRRQANDQMRYGEKISASCDTMVLKLKEFFKDKRLDVETRAALEFCRVELQYEAMSIRARDGSVFSCIYEAVKFIVRFPGMASITMAIKTLIKTILIKMNLYKS